jgi:hypothetical protein
MDDVEALSMDDTALTTAALSGSVDAVAAWSPFSLTILANAKDATDICSNIDFESMASPGSWVVNPKWADENADLLVRFNRAMFKAMDYAAAATTDDAVAQEVAGYVAKVVASDAETVIAQRYDGSWLTSAQVLDMLANGELETLYANQQATFIANGALEAEGNLTPAEFVLSDFKDNGGLGASWNCRLRQEEGDGAASGLLHNLRNGVLLIGNAYPPTRSVTKVFLVEMLACDFHPTHLTKRVHCNCTNLWHFYFIHAFYRHPL